MIDCNAARRRLQAENIKKTGGRKWKEGDRTNHRACCPRFTCIHEGPAQLLGGLRLPRERRHANVLL